MPDAATRRRRALRRGKTRSKQNRGGGNTPAHCLKRSHQVQHQVLINCRNNKKLLGRVKAFDGTTTWFLRMSRKCGRKSRSGKGRAAINKDPFISKMFLRWDSDCGVAQPLGEGHRGRKAGGGSMGNGHGHTARCDNKSVRAALGVTVHTHCTCWRAHTLSLCRTCVAHLRPACRRHLRTTAFRLCLPTAHIDGSRRAA